jgi:hypothetical protein
MDVRHIAHDAMPLTMANHDTFVHFLAEKIVVKVKVELA